MTNVAAISLGWGVQSFTLAAMVAVGELPPVDVALHADTTWERQGTYEFARQWTSWLEARGVRVVTVDAIGKHNDPTTIGQSPIVEIPAYTKLPDSDGQNRRQCTYDWKVQPLRHWLREQGATSAEMWIGISKDEWHRAKDADVKWLRHRWPLLERDMTRASCLAWLARNGIAIPPKSSCTFCPYHSKLAWQHMKREDGADWRQAVEVDAMIRDKRPPYALYVHSAYKPLPEAVVIPEDFGYSQLDLLASTDAMAECDSGYCFI